MNGMKRGREKRPGDSNDGPGRDPEGARRGRPRWRRGIPGGALALGLAVLTPLAGARAAPAKLVVLAGSYQGLTLVTGAGAQRTVPLPGGVIALAPGPAGVTLLLGPEGEPPLGDLGMVAVRWRLSTGSVGLISVDFTTPRMGSMFTGDGYSELQGVVGAFNRTPFALDAFHGGGVGEIFAIGARGLVPDPAEPVPRAGKVALEGNGGDRACAPPVLALLPHGAFLVRGPEAVGNGWSCRYFVLAPGGRLGGLARLDALAREHPLAAAAAFGGQLALLARDGAVYLGPAGGPWRRAGTLTAGRGAGYPAPQGIAFSPRGHRVVATLGDRVALWRLDRGRLAPLGSWTLPAAATSWLPVFASTAVAPAVDGLQRVLREATGLAARAEVILPGPLAAAPQVRIRRGRGPERVCVPLLSWSAFLRPPAAGARTADGCPAPAPSPWPPISSASFFLVPPGRHPGSAPALAEAARRAWVLLPAAGWMPTGPWRLSAREGRRLVERSFSLDAPAR